MKQLFLRVFYESCLCNKRINKEKKIDKAQLYKTVEYRKGPT